MVLQQNSLCQNTVAVGLICTEIQVKVKVSWFVSLL